MDAPQKQVFRICKDIDPERKAIPVSLDSTRSQTEMVLPAASIAPAAKSPCQGGVCSCKWTPKHS